MHAAHDAPSDPLLHDDRRNIHDNIDTAHQSAEEEDDGNSDPEGVYKADREKAHRIEDCPHDQHAPTSDALSKRSRKRHGDD